MSSITKDLRNKSDDELLKLVADLKGRLLKLRFDAANGKIEKTHLIKEIKKTIARALTILNERELNISKEAK